MTARLWIETVGDVSLLGTHPCWPEGLVTDPLVVELEYKSWPFARRDRRLARRRVEHEYDAWTANLAEGGDTGPFALAVAPDALHKANISGGAPYGVLVPDATVDATFRHRDGVVLPFLEYLRRAFRRGGFPGAWRRNLGPEVTAARRALSRDLLEL